MEIKNYHFIVKKEKTEVIKDEFVKSVMAKSRKEAHGIIESQIEKSFSNEHCVTAHENNNDITYKFEIKEK